MTKAKATSPAHAGNAILVEAMSRRYGISSAKAAGMMLKFIRREQEHHFAKGWWLDLMDAQFQTHIGPYTRVRCGRETHLGHLTPDAGELCHDCGCALGEY